MRILLKLICLFLMLFTVRVIVGGMLCSGNTDFQDNTSSLVFYNYRTYNPIEGRWTSRDPIEETISNSNINALFYVRNTPVNKYDLLGLSEVDWSGYTVLDMPPTGAKSGMGAYTFMLPWVTHELMFTDARCSQVGSCHECVCSASSVEFKITIIKKKSWVIRNELRNASLRKHEQNLFDIATELAQQYTEKLDRIKETANEKEEILARLNACEKANNKVGELLKKLRTEIAKQTNNYENRSNYGRDE